LANVHAVVNVGYELPPEFNDRRFEPAQKTSLKDTEVMTLMHFLPSFTPSCLTCTA